MREGGREVRWQMRERKEEKREEKEREKCWCKERGKGEEEGERDCIAAHTRA